jgi:hypothetical protein
MKGWGGPRNTLLVNLDLCHAVFFVALPLPMERVRQGRCAMFTVTGVASEDLVVPTALRSDTEVGETPTAALMFTALLIQPLLALGAEPLDVRRRHGDGQQCSERIKSNGCVLVERGEVIVTTRDERWSGPPASRHVPRAFVPLFFCGSRSQISDCFPLAGASEPLAQGRLSHEPRHWGSDSRPLYASSDIALSGYHHISLSPYHLHEQRALPSLAILALDDSDL